MQNRLNSQVGYAHKVVAPCLHHARSYSIKLTILGKNFYY